MRRLATVKEEARQPYTQQQLPTNQKIALYPRVSTEKQKQNNSTEMQLEDQIQAFIRMGWQEENIVVYPDDLGLSGQLRMDERPSFTKMLSDIVSGGVRAVGVVNVDRLFRERWGIESGKFMQVCEKFGVLVITPDMVYDFKDSYHVERFKRRCEEAYNYLQYQVYGRLHGARDRQAKSGLYSGGVIPLGYIVDYEKSSLTYKKFIPYEPHAVIVREIFRKYQEGTSIPELYKTIPVIPEFESWVDKRVVGRCALKKVPGGYSISLPAFKKLITNPVYIGYFMWSGEIVKAHEAIVPEKDFYRIFCDLSPYLLDGSENENRVKRLRRHNKRENTALLKKVICSSKAGRSVYVKSGDGIAQYVVEERTSTAAKIFLAIPYKEVDEVFCVRLKENLSSASFEDYRERAKNARKENDDKRGSVLVQIDALKTHMKDLETKLLVIKNANLLEQLDTEYSKAQEELHRLEKSLSTPDAPIPVEQLLEYKELLNAIGTGLENTTLEERKLLVHALVDKVELDELSSFCYKLKIYWKDQEWGVEEAVFQRNSSARLYWSKEEVMRLGEVYAGCSVHELLEAFPNRSGRAILTKALNMGLGWKEGLGEEKSVKDKELQTKCGTWSKRSSKNRQHNLDAIILGLKHFMVK